MSARRSDAPARLARLSDAPKKLAESSLAPARLVSSRIGAGKVGIGQVARRKVEPRQIAKREHGARAADAARVQQLMPSGGRCDLLFGQLRATQASGLVPIHKGARRMKVLIWLYSARRG